MWAWSWVPPLLLAVGILLALWARRFKLPGALGGLQVRPFVLESLFKSEPSKLDELRRDYPDLYGLGPTPVGFAGPSKFAVWFESYLADAWDRRIEADVAAGRLGGGAAGN